MKVLRNIVTAFLIAIMVCSLSHIVFADENEYKLCLEVEVQKNLAMAKYDVDVFFDGVYIDTIKHGKTSDIFLIVPAGRHTVEYKKEGSTTGIDGSTEVTVIEDSTFYNKIVNHEFYIEIDTVKTTSGVIDCADTNYVLLDQNGLVSDDPVTCENDNIVSSEKYLVNLEIESLWNVIMAKYDIDIYLDGVLLDTIENSETMNYETELLGGKHRLFFASNDNDDICGSFVFTVNSKGSLYCMIVSHLDEITMYKFILQEGVCDETIDSVAVNLPVVIDKEEEESTIEIVTTETEKVEISEYATEIATEPENEIEIEYDIEPEADTESVIEPEIDGDVETTIEETNVNEYETEYVEKIYDINNIQTIKLVQEKLNEIGLECGIPDGSTGEITRTAICKLESVCGLPVTGIISKDLLTLLGFTFEEEYANYAVIDALSNFAGETLEIIDNGTWYRSNETTWHVENLILSSNHGNIEKTLALDVAYQEFAYIISNITDKSLVNPYDFPMESDLYKVMVPTVINKMNNNGIQEEITTVKNEEIKTTQITKKSGTANYHSSDDSTIAKNGNTGVYAYKSRGSSYTNYIIIDFNEGIVYSFADGNGDNTVMKAKIAQGTLNDVVYVQYNDSGSIWYEGLSFSYMNQPDHLILQDNWGGSYDYYTTELNSALRVKNTRTIIDLSK